MRASNSKGHDRLEKMYGDLQITGKEKAQQVQERWSGEREVIWKVIQEVQDDTRFRA